MDIMQLQAAATDDETKEKGCPQRKAGGDPAGGFEAPFRIGSQEKADRRN
jgi:hypothetical protein